MDYQTLQKSPIVQGDCLSVLATFPNRIFQCCVTSPPYFGLRDYGLPPYEWPEVSYAPMPGTPLITVPTWIGCLGLEPSPEMFVAHMVLVFREVRRVLRDDGTLWLNFGDSYASSPSNKNDEMWGDPANPRKGGRRCRTDASGLKPKDLIGIPWRVAFALQADGWYLRMDNIWSKPNPMPESVTDRPTKSHEYFFLLSKSERYYYDSEAIKEIAVSDHPPGNNSHKGTAAYESGDERHRTKAGLIAYALKTRANSFARTVNESPKPGEPTQHRPERDDIEYGGMRNKRSVWTVATQPFPEAHFATFPEKLIEPCILAGSSRKACGICGTPWKRVVEKERTFESGSGKSGNMPNGKNGEDLQGGGETKDIRRGPVVKTTTLDFVPGCDCEENDGSGKSIIIDPFGGSGTTRKVALENNRDCVLIELNPDYVEIGKRRSSKVQMNLF